jgi:transposase
MSLSIAQPAGAVLPVSIVAADLAKRSFALHGVDERGAVVVRRSSNADAFIAWCQTRLPAGCIIAMEACGSAHHYGRCLSRLGFVVRLIAPHRVTPYRLQGKAAKNDANDAAAICEAATRPHMTFVAIKTEDQQALLLAHSLRQGHVEQRTALVNRVRGALLEFGVTVPQGIEKLRQVLPKLLDRTSSCAAALPDLVCKLLQQELEHWAELDRRIDEAQAPINRHAREDVRAKLLQDLHGMGPLGASALVAHLGDMTMFNHARQPAAWLGIVPSQHSTGGKVRLGGISKHGDPALRTLLITGARSAVQSAHLRQDPISQWLTKLRERCGWQKACVALVNKNLRIAWAMLTRGTVFDPAYQPRPVAASQTAKAAPEDAARLQASPA